MTTKFSKVIPYLKKKNMEVLEMVESDFSMRILCKP